MSETLPKKLESVKIWAEREPQNIAVYIISWCNLEHEAGVRKSVILLNLLGAEITKLIAVHFHLRRRCKLALEVLVDLEPRVDEHEQEAVLDELLAKGSFNTILAAKIYCQKETLKDEKLGII